MGVTLTRIKSSPNPHRLQGTLIHFKTKIIINATVAREVMQRIANPLYVGSSPTGSSKFMIRGQVGKVSAS